MTISDNPAIPTTIEKGTIQGVSKLSKAERSKFYDQTPEDYIPYVKPEADPLATSFKQMTTSRGWK